MNTSIGPVLLEHWRSQPAITLASPVTAPEIEAFERQYRVQLPKEVREYYFAANGFEPPKDQDEHGFSFWSLRRVRPLNAIDNDKWSSAETRGCFLFADYLSLSWGYAFCVTSDSDRAPVCIVGTATQKPQWIAENFREFVDLYVRDDERLYSANVR